MPIINPPDDPETEFDAGLDEFRCKNCEAIMAEPGYCQECEEVEADRIRDKRRDDLLTGDGPDDYDGPDDIDYNAPSQAEISERMERIKKETGR